MTNCEYSIIVPVYNRPDEVAELLESLTAQTVKDFEVIIVEDGSERDCRAVAEQYAGKLDVRYFAKKNSGPGPSRNYGAERAKGEWLIVLDSDVVVPPGYLQAIADELASAPADAFGGPDRAHPSFTDTQKAISYSMTSFFTTGGIRGGKKKLDKFYPRSFNMGVRRDVYLRLGGFSKMRFGEDIDFSLRIVGAGCRCRLFPGAWVWHKRRTDMRKFFRQVYNSGIARINLQKRHPGSLKLVHLLPYGVHGGRNGPLADVGRRQAAHALRRPAPLVLALRRAVAAHTGLLRHHSGRLGRAQQEPEDRAAVGGRRLRAAHGLRLRIHRGMVEAVHIGQKTSSRLSSAISTNSHAGRASKGMGNNNDNTPRDEARPRLTIADWAEDDRPREKLALRGPAALSNAELLAILKNRLGLGGRKRCGADQESAQRLPQQPQHARQALYCRSDTV